MNTLGKFVDHRRGSRRQSVLAQGRGGGGGGGGGGANTGVGAG